MLFVPDTACLAANHGAIATSKATNAKGWSYNMPDRKSAEKHALSKCKQSDCKVVIWFYNNCGAVAAGPDGRSWGAMSDTREDAEKRALGLCGVGNGPCVVQAWACNKQTGDSYGCMTETGLQCAAHCGGEQSECYRSCMSQGALHCND